MFGCIFSKEMVQISKDVIKILKQGRLVCKETVRYDMDE